MARPVTRRTVLYAALPLTLVALIKGHDLMQNTPPGKYFPDPRVAELAEAAAHGNVARVQTLVAGGVDPNARGDQGVTPLLWATHIGNTAGMAALMRAGADPTLGDDRTRTPLSMAIDGPEENGPEDAKRLKALIENGAPVNFVDRDETLLMRATLMKHPDQVQYLIQAGADVNWQDSAGNTALFNAGLPEAWQCALLLLEAGVDPLHRNRGSNSFVDLLAVHPKLSLMMPEGLEHRARVLAWLRALVTRRGEVVER